MTRPPLTAALTVAGILAVAVFLRLAWLDRLPPGINQDEAVHAYDAWCLRELGTDHYGQRWPVFFRAFGDYHPGNYVYALLPIQALAGVSTWTTRLAAALAGALTVLFVYLLVRRMFDSRAALIAASLAALSPWHIHLARLGYEISLAVPLLTLGLMLLARAFVRTPLETTSAPLDRRLTAFTAGAVLGLAAWSSNATRVVTPLLLLAAALLARRWRQACPGHTSPADVNQSRNTARDSRRRAALLLLGLAVGLAPFLWTTLRAPHEAWARATSVSIFARSASFGEAAGRAASNYLLHFSPRFLFLEGDRRWIESVPDYGRLHAVYAVLLPVGVLRILRRRREEPAGLLALAWLALGPLPAALSDITGPYSLRAAGGLPAWDIVAALGLDAILRAIPAPRRMLRGGVAVAFALALAAGFARFVHVAVTRYPPIAAVAFQSEWPEVFDEVRRRGPEYDAVCLTTRRTNQLGMLYLFWNRVPPRAFVFGPHEIRRGAAWDQIVRIGDVHFRPIEQIDAVLDTLPAGARVLIAERPDAPRTPHPLRLVSGPHGSEAVFLYELIKPQANGDRLNPAPASASRPSPAGDPGPSG